MELYSVLMPYMWVIIAIVIGLAVAISTIIITVAVFSDRNMKKSVRLSAEEAQKKSKDYMIRMQRDNQVRAVRHERDYEQTKALVRGNLYAPDYKQPEGEDSTND